MLQGHEAFVPRREAAHLRFQQQPDRAVAAVVIARHVPELDHPPASARKAGRALVRTKRRLEVDGQFGKIVARDFDRDERLVRKLDEAALAVSPPWLASPIEACASPETEGEQPARQAIRNRSRIENSSANRRASSYHICLFPQLVLGALVVRFRSQGGRRGRPNLVLSQHRRKTANATNGC
jgi:hypothetical protein